MHIAQILTPHAGQADHDPQTSLADVMDTAVMQMAPLFDAVFVTRGVTDDVPNLPRQEEYDLKPNGVGRGQHIVQNAESGPRVSEVMLPVIAARGQAISLIAPVSDVPSTIVQQVPSAVSASSSGSMSVNPENGAEQEHAAARYASDLDLRQGMQRSLATASLKKVASPTSDIQQAYTEVDQPVRSEAVVGHDLTRDTQAAFQASHATGSATLHPPLVTLAGVMLQSAMEPEQSVQDEVGLRVVEQVSAQPSDMKSSLPSRIPDVPRIVSAQIADIIRQHPERPVELTLNPEELGRLRMSFQSDGGTMHVTLNFERPETLDLMRRHIDQLAQELQSFGMSDVSFTFQQQTADGGDGSPTKTDAAHRADNEDQPFIPASPDTTLTKLTFSDRSGVDIRV